MKPLRLLILLALIGAFASTNIAFAQNVIRQSGNLHVTDSLTSNITPAPSLAGSIVTATFVDSTSQQFVWQDLGGNLGGVVGALFDLTVDSNDVFQNPWTFTNFGTDVVALDLQLAPSQTVFDLDNGGTPGSGGAGQEFELLAGTDVPLASITATYSDIVALAGNAPVGDIYARLTIDFSQAIQANESVVFRNDLDSTTSEVIQVPEPCSTSAMMLAFGGLMLLRKRKIAE